MLSARLIHLIETHEETISTRILREIRRDPRLAHLAGLPDAELHERGHEILKNLGHWLSLGSEEEIARKYEGIGKIRFQEAVPLHESIQGLCLIKYAMVDFIHEQGVDKDCVALYAEEELERRVAKFFDWLVTHMAQGYELEWRHAAYAHS